MIAAPIDVDCPRCGVHAGVYCMEWRSPDRREGTSLTYHHADRVDAAARRAAAAAVRSSLARHKDLTDEEVGAASLEDLREAYRSLRAHHVRETTTLVGQVKRMRPVFAAAIDWRKHINLLSADPLTQRMTAAIDAAIAADAAAAAAAAKDPP